MARIAFFIPSLAVGGAEKNTVRLANYFCARGHDVWIYTVSEELQLAHELRPEVRLVSLALAGMRHLTFRVGAILRRERIDVVISNLWPLNLWVVLGQLISATLRTTLLIEHINLSEGLDVHSGLERSASKLFHKYMLNSRIRMIAVSKGVMLDLIQHFKVHPGKISVVYNPVIENFEGKARLKRQRNPGRALRLLAVGNFKPQKDYPNLLKAMKVLKDRRIDFELAIAGDGYLRPEIENCIRQLGLESQVRLLGLVLDTEPLYLGADIYVLSSAWEGFGNTIVEALSYGCKVVSTDCPSGPAEILQGGTYGQLVPVADHDALAEAIIYAGGREIDASAQISYCRKFSDSVVGDQYLKLCGLA